MPANACVGSYTLTIRVPQSDGESTATTTFTVPSNALAGGALQPGELLGGKNPGECYPCDEQFTDYPVTASTGNFWHTFDEFTIPGRGVPLRFSHTYNSAQAAVDGPLGFGWSFNYGMSLTTDPVTGAVTVNQENASHVTLMLSGSTYTPAAPRMLATLVHNGDGTYTFTRNAREVFIFDSNGKLLSLKDLNGYTTALAYPDASTTVVTDPAGRTLTLTYAGPHITSASDDAGSRQVAFAYHGDGNLTDITDVADGTWKFTYDSAHRMLTMRDPNQAGVQNPPVVTNHYDSSGRVDWQKDQLNRQTSFDYTSIPNSTKITDPNGNITVDTFDFGVLASETRGYGTQQAATWRYFYDQNTAAMAAVVDPNGHTTARYLDAAGNVTGTNDSIGGRFTSATYDSLSDVTQTVSARYSYNYFTYDAAGNVLSRSDPATTFTYGDAAHPGDVTAITDANNKTWTFAYDTYGNLTRSSDPFGNATVSCYDAIGLKTAQISPKGTAAGVTCASSAPAPFTSYFTYNALGHPLTAKDPLGHQTVWTYDANQQLKTVKDPDDNTTTNTYDAANQLTTVTRADDTTLHYEYFPDGALQRYKDGKNNPTTYAYDAQAQLISITDPLNRTTTYGYDPAGNRTSIVQPGNLTTTLGYDADNELTSMSYSGGTTPNVTMGYDADGNRISMTDGTGTSSWTWDGLRRMRSSTNGANQTVGYGYDPKGQLTTITYPGTTGTVTRGYDDAGRLQSVTDWLSHQTTFGYDPNSNLTSQSSPNGVSATFTVDDADRVMGIAYTKTPTTLASFTYGRDNADQLTSVTSTGVPTDNNTYTYTARRAEAGTVAARRVLIAVRI